MGGSGGSGPNNSQKEPSPSGDPEDKSGDQSSDKRKSDDQKRNGDAQNDSAEKDDNFNNLNNDVESCKKSEMDDHSNPASPGSQQDSFLLGDIPVDKENPNCCVECRDEFTNHFELKQHFQNVHLNLLHKCTIEGCNAGFPSKRSRDRHSSNFNLHRKLLSTTSEKSDTKVIFPTISDDQAKTSAALYQSELLARLYAEQRSAMEGQSNHASFLKKMEGAEFPGLAGIPFPGLFAPMGGCFPAIPPGLMPSPDKLRQMMGLQHQEVPNHS